MDLMAASVWGEMVAGAALWHGGAMAGKLGSLPESSGTAVETTIRLRICTGS